MVPRSAGTVAPELPEETDLVAGELDLRELDLRACLCVGLRYLLASISASFVSNVRIRSYMSV